MTQKENHEQLNINQYFSHSGTRYWGKVEVIEQGDNYRINRIEIKPKQGIKPQIHYHRSEHWVVVSGVAKVTCGNQEILLNRNESTYVPQATLHHVENPGFIPLIILEIQNGEYLGEDDTERPYRGHGSIWGILYKSPKTFFRSAFQLIVMSVSAEYWYYFVRDGGAMHVLKRGESLDSRCSPSRRL